MILTTMLLMQGQVLAPEDTGEEGRRILPNIFSADDHLDLFGRFQQDFAYVDDETFGTKDGSEVRRARLGVGGNLAGLWFGGARSMSWSTRPSAAETSRPDQTSKGSKGAKPAGGMRRSTRRSMCTAAWRCAKAGEPGPQ